MVMKACSGGFVSEPDLVFDGLQSCCVCNDCGGLGVGKLGEVCQQPAKGIYLTHRGGGERGGEISACKQSTD